MMDNQAHHQVWLTGSCKFVKEIEITVLTLLASRYSSMVLFDVAFIYCYVLSENVLRFGFW